MTKHRKLWVDDVRTPPDWTWQWAITYREGLNYLLANADIVTHISLDHDLGTGETGYDLACVVEELAMDGRMKSLKAMTTHSANPVGRDRILQAIQKIMILTYKE